MSGISVTAEGISANQAAATAVQMGTMVARKALDIQAQQGAALVNLMNSSAGLGQNLNTQG